VVVAIMSLLMMLVVPSVNDILKARKLAASAGELMDLLELARNEALNQQSYVYLCLDEKVTPGGDDQIEAFYLVAKGGTAGAGGGSISWLERASRVYRWENVKLVPSTTIDPEIMEKSFGSEEGSTLTVPSSTSLSDIPKTKFEFGEKLGDKPMSARAVIFSPQGYALFQPGLSGSYIESVSINTPYEKYVDFGLRATIGGVEQSGPASEAVVLLNGANGHIQLLRH